VRRRRRGHQIAQNKESGPQSHGADCESTHENADRNSCLAIVETLGAKDLADPLLQNWIAIAVAENQMKVQSDVVEIPRGKKVDAILGDIYSSAEFDLFGAGCQADADGLLNLGSKLAALIRGLRHGVASKARVAPFVRETLLGIEGVASA